MLAGDAAFHANSVPTVLMDRDYVIRAVNPAFALVTGRSKDALLSFNAFDAFPDNPDDPQADGVERMGESLEQVLRTGTADNMVIQRYDIADEQSGKFVPRHWVPVNSPLMHEGSVVGIMQQVTDVTILRRDVVATMERYRDLIHRMRADSVEAENHRSIVDAYTEGIAQYKNLADEVAQLREAVKTRAPIEQAKGMLMLTRRCSADEAFGILRKLSQDTNVRLTDVAAALIYQLQSAN